MKKSALIVLWFMLIGLLAEAQVRVTSLNADSIANIPLNRFFFLTSPFAHGAPDYEMACVKTNADVSEFVAIMNRFQKVEAANETDHYGTTTYVWHNANYPTRFYQNMYAVMQVRNVNGQQLFCFWDEVDDLRNDGKNKKKRARIDRGVDGNNLRYVQTLLNHQIYCAPIYSLFNYGLGYISMQERMALGMNEVYEIYKLPEGETGGMHENWEVTKLEIDEEGASEQWAPTYRDSNFVFNFENLTDSARYLNSSIFNVENGTITDYGGEGYGSFNYHEINRLSHEISVRITYATGHASDTSVGVAIWHRGKYLRPDTLFLLGRIAEDNLPEVFSLEDISKLILLAEEAGYESDTVFYRRSEFGQVTSITPSLHKMQAQGLVLIPNIYNAWNESTDWKIDVPFYQLYVGQEKMEAVIMAQFGYLPDIISLQFANRGAFVFMLNAKRGCYVKVDTLVIE
jgi:hypothetical protein